MFLWPSQKKLIFNSADLIHQVYHKPVIHLLTLTEAPKAYAMV